MQKTGALRAAVFFRYLRKTGRGGLNPPPIRARVLSDDFHTNTTLKTHKLLPKRSIVTLKYGFIASDKDVFVGLANSNRVNIHYALPEVTRIRASSFQESSCFDILNSLVS